MAQPATVLILADVDDAVRAGLEAACTEAGFAPVVEPSAEVATGKLGQKRFDALVLHMTTPGAALACMRARGKLLRIRVPILALADVEEDMAFARAYRAGADEVLVVGDSSGLTARLRSLPKPSLPQPGNSRGDAIVADADRTRGEVIERVLRDAGFRVEVVVDGFAARLQAGRPSLKVAVVEASLDDVPVLISQAKNKGARCAWVVRARPELLDDLRKKLEPFDRIAVVSAYGPPDDVLFETNRLIEPRPADGRADPRLLYGSIAHLEWKDGPRTIAYTYNVSPLGLYLRTVLPPAGDTLSLDVLPPGRQERIRLDAKVIWRREFGTTRKEPVPAGFGLKLVGGDIGAWAESCPIAPSLRPSMQEERRGSGPPRRMTPPPERAVTEPPKGIVPPGDVDIQAREPQSSVEEMLASVLNETIPAEEAVGSAPLSIEAGNVVELKAGEEAEASGAANHVESPVPPKIEPMPATIASRLASVSSATETPLAITPATLGFAREAESNPAAAAAPTERPPEEVPAKAEKPEKAEPGIENSDTIPAPSLASRGIDLAAFEASLDEDMPIPPPSAVPAEAVALARKHGGPLEPPSGGDDAASVPPSARGSGNAELKLPTSRTSPIVWVLGAAAIGAVVALFALPRGGTTTPPTPVSSVGTAVSAPSAVEAPPSAAPEEAPAPSAAAPPEASAAPSASAPPPEPAASAAPEPTTPEPPSAPAPSSDAEGAALATLKKGQGLLLVASSLQTNVYVYGLLAGTTNQAIATNCGPRFIRLGSKPGAWQGEGVVQIVKCGALTRVQMSP